MEILKGTSPELAIKIAYDFARSLRINGNEDGLPNLLQAWVIDHFEDSPLLPYIRAGFIAGHNYDSLPWRRQIDEDEARKRAAREMPNE